MRLNFNIFRICVWVLELDLKESMVKVIDMFIGEKKMFKFGFFIESFRYRLNVKLVLIDGIL